MKFLLDTNIVSEVAKKRPNAKVVNWLLAHETQCAVPSVVVAERYHGAHKAESDQIAKLLAEVDWFCATNADSILPFDTAAAKAWGEYVSRPTLKNNPRSYPDTQIAAIALAHELIVVTRNTQDFPEIETCNPFEED